MKSPAKWIRRLPHFQGLDPAFVDSMSLSAQEKMVEQGQFIFKQGESARYFYLLQKGQVALEIYSADQGVVRIQTLHDGDILGWSWMFPPYQWHFDARALTDTLLWEFDAIDLLNRCEADPAMGYQIQQGFSRIMLERLQATRLQLLDVYRRD